jgi:RNA polymerase sigma factor (sigma-70 family)
MTEDCDDVTRWIGELRQQSPDAQARIFELYFGRATRLAGRRLASSRRREQDEEDIALSAMHSFFAGVAAEQFDRLTNRDDLWAIIAVITSRKAIRQLRRQATQKRGGGQERGESVFNPDGPGLAGVGAQADGQAEADARELGDWLLAQLPDPMLRNVALMRLEGLTTEEIATSLGVVPRTVERKLARIRDVWLGAAGGTAP